MAWRRAAVMACTSRPVRASSTAATIWSRPSKGTSGGGLSIAAFYVGAGGRGVALRHVLPELAMLLWRGCLQVQSALLPVQDPQSLTQQGQVGLATFQSGLAFGWQPAAGLILQALPLVLQLVQALRRCGLQRGALGLLRQAVTAAGQQRGRPGQDAFELQQVVQGGQDRGCVFAADVAYAKEAALEVVAGQQFLAPQGGLFQQQQG